MVLGVDILAESAKIVTLVFVMMVAVDLLNLWSRGRVGSFLAGGQRWRQYVIIPLLAAVPGCLGAFTAVSLYLHGLIGFGALAGAMVASSGDEAFVMLAMFPRSALILFVALVFFGMMQGWVIDKMMARAGIRPFVECDTPSVHPVESGIRHYLREHVWRHIIRKHIGKTAMWTVVALAIVRIGVKYANLQTLTTQYPLAALVLSGIIGLIPESGPHLIVVTLFANGAVPFSVLLTSSIVQDGHGMLPLLAHSLRDSMLLKVLNLATGLLVGGALYSFGF